MFITGRSTLHLEIHFKVKCISNTTAKWHAANILPVPQFCFPCVLLMMTDSTLNTLYNLYVYQTALTPSQYNHIKYTVQNTFIRD